MSILIVGYGNPLRGDDGLGWRAVEILENILTDQISDLKTVEIGAYHQLTPELAEPASRADFVIFIDARNDGVPGEFRAEPVIPAATLPPVPFSHHIDPPALLAYARDLYGTCPEAVLLSITGESFGYEEGLSRTAQDGLAVLVQRVQELVADLAGKRRPSPDS